VPEEKSEKKDTQSLRYLAIRIRDRQENLFADRNKVKHFAVVANIDKWKPSRLIEWHREIGGLEISVREHNCWLSRVVTT
jgi:hypothetical protein